MERIMMSRKEKKPITLVLVITLIMLCLPLAMIIMDPSITGFSIMAGEKEILLENITLDYNQEIRLGEFGEITGIGIDGAFSGKGSALVYASNLSQRYLIFNSSETVNDEESAGDAPEYIGKESYALNESLSLNLSGMFYDKENLTFLAAGTESLMLTIEAEMLHIKRTNATQLPTEITVFASDMENTIEQEIIIAASDDGYSEPGQAEIIRMEEEGEAEFSSACHACENLSLSGNVSIVAIINESKVKISRMRISYMEARRAPIEDDTEKKNRTGKLNETEEKEQAASYNITNVSVIIPPEAKEAQKMNGSLNITINETGNMSINITQNASMNMSQNLTSNLTKNITINMSRANETNMPPYWSSGETEFIVNSTLSINLSGHFTDPDGDNITFLASAIENVSVSLDREILNIAYQGVEKYANLSLFAYDSYNYTEQVIWLRVLNMTMPEASEGMAIQGMAEIGKPVRWTRNVSKKPNESLAISIAALPGTVRVRDSVRKEEIKEYRVTVHRKEPESGRIASIKSAKPENLTVEIESNDTAIEIEYFTEAPSVHETEISGFRKTITISSETHYTDVLAYTSIGQARRESIRVYWLLNSTRTLFTNITYIDSDNNTLVDRIEWLVPHLSNQTFEVEISVINVQSFPALYGNWTVYFTTEGEGFLRITGVNSTTFAEVPDNPATKSDLEFGELLCGVSAASDVYLVSSGNVSMPYEAYKIKRRIEAIEKELEELG